MLLQIPEKHQMRVLFFDLCRNSTTAYYQTDKELCQLSFNYVGRNDSCSDLIRILSF